jgi:SAM-dependent methyltransferase
VHKVCAQPDSESPGFFGLFALRNLLVILALEHYSLTTLLFPAVIASACVLVMALILVQQRRPMTDQSKRQAANDEPLPAATDQANDRHILESWAKNAAPWTTAIREQQIASRRQATDQAIIDAITDFAPGSVLDVGCGESWLVRALTVRGILASGVDAIPAFIAQSRRAGPEAYYLASYQDIAQGQLKFQADTLVCNFSLFGKTSVETLFAAIGTLLPNGGRLIAQTLHPLAACGDQPYRDGWRIG